jgi:hypothetical protein
MYAQVNWNTYQEPNNTIRNFSVGLQNSWSNFGLSNTNQSTLNLSSSYSSRQVKELSILNIASNFRINEIDQTPENFSQLNFNIGLTKYFNKRRGLFIEGGAGYSVLAFNENRPNIEDVFDQHNLQLFLGWGRMENVERVYQAIRVNNKLDASGLSDQDRIFQIADGLSQINYNDVFNNKSEDAAKLESILGLLQQEGASISNLTELSALNVAKFERPNFLRQGKSIKIGLQEFGTFSNANISANLTLDYATAINDKFHFDAQVSLTQRLTDDRDGLTGSLRTVISYLPTSRLRVDWISAIGFSDFRSNNSQNYSSSILASYALTPNVSVFGGFGYAISRTQFSGINFPQAFTSKGFQGNIGINVRF